MIARLVPLALTAFALIAVVRIAPAVAADQSGSVLDLKAKSIDGQEQALAQYKGKVVLIVNTASQCGYTPQYKGLQALYEKYHGQGLEILAFPANEFGGQEPGSDDEIKTFCTKRYQTTFPLFSKIVVKGEGKHPVYQFLTDAQANPKTGGEIRWNFTKFLVDRDGKVIARFEPAADPESPEVTQAVESALKAGK